MSRSVPGTQGALARLFAIDLRALATFRVAIGTLILVDLALRSRELRTHYTDAGLMPREILNPWASETIAPLHLLSGAAWYEAGLFVLGALFALMLVAGYRTRVATLACWVWSLSLYVRNPAICDFADTLMRVLLFWSMFLPLGVRWSLDARRRSTPPTGTSVLSFASAALLLQIFFVYFFTAMQKDGPDWRSDFTAIYYALHQDWWVRPLGAWLGQYTSLLGLLTLLTILFEILGPLLLFSPVFTSAIRVALVICFVGFQTGLGFSLQLGLFPWLSSTMMLVFLPASVWDRAEGMFGTRPRPAPATPAPAWRPYVGRITQGGVALLLLYALAFNVADAYRDLPFPKSLARAGYWIGLSQHWGMYSPNGPRYDGWYVIPGTLHDGRLVNLWDTGPELSWEKPLHIASYHHSVRTAVYEFSLSRPRYDEPGYRVHRERYAEWLCRKWNRSHSGGERVESLEVWFMQEPTAPPGVEPVVQRRLLIRHSCASPDPV